MASQTSSSTAMDGSSSSITKFVPVSFTNSSTVRLDQNNFIVWRKQVLTTVRGHKLQSFLFGSSAIPKKFLSDEDKNNDRRLGTTRPTAGFVASLSHDRVSPFKDGELRDFVPGLVYT